MDRRLHNLIEVKHGVAEAMRLGTHASCALDSCVPKNRRALKEYSPMTRWGLKFALIGFLVGSLGFAVSPDANFTKVLTRATQLAQSNSHAEVRLEHMMASLAQGMNGPELRDLREDLGLSQDQLKQVIAALNEKMSDIPKIAGGKPPVISEGLSSVIRDADLMAQSADQNFLRPAHVLAKLVEAPGDAAFTDAVRVLNLTENRVAELSGMDRKAGEERSSGPRKSELDKYTIPLKTGEHDIVGRVGEVQELLKVLFRPENNSVVLSGEVGVGRDAIVEAAQKKIAAGNVPESLKGKTIVVLDPEKLEEGAKYRGELTERLRALKTELASRKDVILYIPDSDKLLGAKEAEGSAKAEIVNSFASGLSEGLQVIFQTSPENVRKFEQRSSLWQRVQLVKVPVPSKEVALQILGRRRRLLEARFPIKFEPGAVEAAYELSERHMDESAQPGRTYQLMAATVTDLAFQQAVKGMLDWEKLEDELIRLEERKSELLEEGISAKNKSELKSIEKRLLDVESRLAASRKSWDVGHEMVTRLDDLKNDPEGNTAEIQKLSEDIAALQKTRTLVTREHLSKKVEALTGKPAGNLNEDLKARLRRLEDDMARRVIGQPLAVSTLAATARNGASGNAAKGRPLGVILLYGPTGVGKTEITKVLADVVFDSEEALHEIDMTDYMEKLSMSRLVGAPPGYVGFEEGGQLTEKVRSRPYAVVQLDEIEMAHPDILKLLMPVLDSGRLVDGQGRTVDFTNTFVIMTTNAGQEIAARTDIDDVQKDALLKHELEYKRGVPREVIGRIDGFVPFKKLDTQSMRKILQLQLDRWQRGTSEPKGLEVVVMDGARDKLAELGYQPDFGARPLRRAIEVYLTNEFTNLELNHEAELEAAERFVMKYEPSDDHFEYHIPAKGAAVAQIEGPVDGCPSALAKLRVKAKPIFAPPAAIPAPPVTAPTALGHVLGD